ncbi:MAG: type II secretion system ATPase GspE [Alphaproteobacteria bacterium]
MTDATAVTVEDGETFDQALGRLLIEADRLDAAGLQRAERARQAGGEPLHLLLPKLGMVSEQAMAEALAEALDLPLVTASDYPDMPVRGDSLRVSFLKASRILPLDETEAALVVAVADPRDEDAIKALRLFANKPIEVRVGVPADIEGALDRLYGQSETADNIVEDAALSGDLDPVDDIQRLRDLASEAPVVRIVNRMISRAVERQASDIHIEPFEQGLRIRYRIDGILQEGEQVPREQHAALISRLKIMANLNIAERRLPQDGRIKLAVRGRDIDLRIATMPIMLGEAAVLRILDRGSVQLDFEKLGFSADALKAYRSAIERPNGIVLVTGPTGSGKTTTLYTSLDEINGVERKILTVEDPIEYQLAGINQVQIKPQIGLTFAHVLRAMLRHDPDVIMVGEIRDLETAEIAIQAALTGHLVFSTLHTNNAAGTLMRLMDMGVETYLMASTLNAVVAQRLVRKLCTTCREEFEPLPEMLEQLGLELWQVKKTWRAVGCEACRQTGYRGRLSINEVMVMTDAIRQAVLGGTDAHALHRIACESGMRPMFQDGIDKVKAGVTTVEEVLRVTREGA